ncbi:MAG: hypothetical protein GF401_10685 [Chitinivibrionales bacterium]|nr:hypothetical protein [Chitinivibrionales bacterium]
MAFLRLLSIPALLSLVLCSNFGMDSGDGSAVSDGTDGGGASETVGIIYNARNTPAESAWVYVVPESHNPYRDSGSYLDSLQTDSAGAYRLDLQYSGKVNILALKGNTRAFRSSVSLDNSVSGDATDTLRDTLKAPGSLSGVVRLQPGDDSRYVLVLVMGTNRLFSPLDSIGNFVLDALAEGTYDVRFIVVSGNYVPFDTVMTITSGVNRSLADTLFLEYTGIPVPRGVEIDYDSLSPLVSFQWDMLDTSLIGGYNIYRRTTDSNPKQLNEGVVDDTFFIDSLNGGPDFDTKYSYSVVAVDKSGNEGQKACEVDVTVKGKCRGWTQLNPISPRTNAHACVINGTIYLLGGENNDGPLGDVWRYDLANDSWTRLASIPEPRKGACVVAVDTSIVYFGGMNENWLSSFYKFIPESNTWILVDNDWVLSYNAVACTHLSTVYCIGGERITGGISDSTIAFEMDDFSLFYDLGLMNIARTNHSIVELDSLLVSLGGWDGELPLTSVEIYDPVSDNWQIKSSLQYGRKSLACASIDGNVYAIGGEGVSKILDVNECYNPQTDSWELKSPMPTARKGAAAAVVDNKIYVIGGSDANGILGVVEVYDPLSDF